MLCEVVGHVSGSNEPFDHGCEKLDFEMRRRAIERSGYNRGIEFASLLHKWPKKLPAEAGNLWKKVAKRIPLL